METKYGRGNKREGCNFSMMYGTFCTIIKKELGYCSTGGRTSGNNKYEKLVAELKLLIGVDDDY